MTTFEVDTDIVKSFLKEAPFERLAIAELAVELERQMAPAPIGLCAVIRDHNGTLWVRIDNDPEDMAPLNWRATGSTEEGGEWKRTEELPRPFTVLFEGVSV